MGGGDDPVRDRGRAKDEEAAQDDAGATPKGDPAREHGEADAGNREHCHRRRDGSAKRLLDPGYRQHEGRGISGLIHPATLLRANLGFNSLLCRSDGTRLSKLGVVWGYPKTPRAPRHAEELT